MNKEDYFKYYIQGSDHYLIPKDVVKELFDEMINWRDESKKQKEVIDKVIEYINKYESIKAYYEYIDEDGYDELEIIEESKKIEKIARCDSIKMTYYGELYKPTENEEILRIKINELIDEINNLKEND